MSEFNLPIAMGFAFTALATGWISSYFDLGVDDENASRFTLWYRNRSGFARGVVDGLLAAVVGIAGENWVTDQVLPAWGSGLTAIVIVALLSVVSLGLGLSIGKAITHENYRFLRQP